MFSAFRKRRPDPAAQLAAEIRAVDEQIKDASPGYEAQYLNRAGDLCAEARENVRALSYYGRAIDHYLEFGRYEAAEALCRKVLRISPDAVRAHCTLAWIPIGRGKLSEADPAIEDYVQAAVRVGQEALATRQLRMMAEATSDPELRERLAEHLLRLGDSRGADAVFGEVYAEQNGIRSPDEASEHEIWASLLRAALMSPQELREPPPALPQPMTS